MTTETASMTVPTVDHDPLPEASWFWRRIFTFAVTAAILWMVWGAITRLGTTAVMAPTIGIPALLSLCKSLLYFTFAMVTYYMVAPSAEQIVKMVQVAGMLKGGVQFASRTLLTTPETSSATSAVAGQTLPEPVPDAAPGVPETVPATISLPAGATPPPF